MKGYLFAVSGVDDIPKLMDLGAFGVQQNTVTERDRPAWNWQMQATFADYMTIDPGDLIFLFSDRRIYGVGRVRSLEGHPTTGAWWNWPDAADPASEAPEEALTLPGGRTPRVVVPFEPAPVIFRRGIDMDEVLTHPHARPDWRLFFWGGLSFSSLEEQETATLYGALVRRFGEDAAEPVDTSIRHFEPQHPFRFSDLLAFDEDQYVDEDGDFRKEATLHGLFIQALKDEPGILGLESDAQVKNKSIFHEVPASPPKASSRWVNRFDVLRIRTWGDRTMNFPHHWDIFECKKDALRKEEPERALAQLMAYVDFMAREKTAGDYGAVSGHWVAPDYADALINRLAGEGFDPRRLARSYVLDPHEEESLKAWEEGLFLWRYDWDRQRSELSLDRVFPAE